MTHFPSAIIYANQNLDNSRICVGGSVDVDQQIRARAESDRTQIASDKLEPWAREIGLELTTQPLSPSLDIRIEASVEANTGAMA